MWKLFCILVILISLEMLVAPPVDKKKENSAKNSTEELDDFGLEYGRYLAQVVQTLEEDKEFAKRLENITTDQIRSGAIAKELEFVKHNVRSKLDELKRIEVDRLRKLIQQQMERTELGLYRDGDGHLLNTPDGRRWRTIPSYKGGLDGGFWCWAFLFRLASIPLLFTSHPISTFFPLMLAAPLFLLQ